MSLIAAAGAALFALHLLSGGEDEAASGVAAPLASAGSAPPDASNLAPPSASELARFTEATQAETMHSLAGLLPRNDRDAARLKALEVRALVKQGRLGSARIEARDYFERWPGGPDTAALETLTGIHASDPKRADAP